jgi:outer membrane immunogenic protein
VKNFLFGVALLGALGAAPALADDRPISRPAMPYSWTGFYLGGEAGQRAVSSTWQGNCFEGAGGGCTYLSRPPTTESLSSAGPQLGGFVGYNWQFSQFGLLGVESDIAWGHSKASLAGGFPGMLRQYTSLDDKGYESAGGSGSIRGRLGVLPMPGLLIYGTGGVAFQQFSFNAHCPDDGGSYCGEVHNETASMVRTGYTVGAGIEKAFGGPAGMLDDGPWRVRLEYRYANFGHFDHMFFNNPGDAFDVIGVSFPLHTQTVQLGLAYGF